MSNCYDHAIKKNMLSTVYGSKEALKKDIFKNYQDLKKWYEEQCELYMRPLGGDFDQWYEEYAGGTWEENNKEDKPEPNKTYALTGGKNSRCIANGNSWKDSEVKN